MNAFDARHYQQLWKTCSAVFDPKYAGAEPEETEEVGDGLTVRTRHYGGQPPELPYSLRACESVLLNCEGKTIYTWRCLDDDAVFSRLIRHQNGRRYLIFRRDLYGYSVLELDSGRDSHYVPLESCPERQEDFRETFIWTGAEYDPASSLLAVPGCFWACPNSVIVLDFRDPLTPQERWLDVQEVIDPEYDRYDGLDFAGWDGERGLLLRALSPETRAYEPVCVPAATLRELLGQKEKHPV